MLTLQERFRTVDTADGGVVLDVDNGRVFRLNPTGMQVLALLQQEIPIDRIAEQIGRERDVDPQTVREDLRAFLSSLAERGLLPTIDTQQGR